MGVTLKINTSCAYVCLLFCILTDKANAMKKLSWLSLGIKDPAKHMLTTFSVKQRDKKTPDLLYLQNPEVYSIVLKSVIS